MMGESSAWDYYIGERLTEVQREFYIQIQSYLQQTSYNQIKYAYLSMLNLIFLLFLTKETEAEKKIIFRFLKI